MRISVLDHSPVAEGRTAAEALRDTVEFARLAERWGYHRFWLAEHHALASHASPAPEVLISRIAAETSEIRVGSGGVLLSLYSSMKVAEVFRMLHALYPDRVDLGIGRSFGALAAEVRALGHDPDRPPSEEEFGRKLSDLLGFLGDGFPEGHACAGIPIMPSVEGAPPVWLLGSSPRSGEMAGRFGLPYSYAHFINAETTRASIDAYRAAFVPSARLSVPQVVLGVGVYCAEADAEAERLYASHRLIRHRLARNVLAPVPDPDVALKELAADREPVADKGEWPRCAVGTPAQVRSELTSMAAELGVDELVVMAFIHDQKERLRSYELLADALR